MEKQQSTIKITKMEKPEYVNFPIALLRNFTQNREQRIADILAYGIVKYGQSFRVTIDNVAKQAIYCMYNQPKSELAELLEGLYMAMDEAGYTEMRGFNVHGEFDPKVETETLQALFRGEPYIEEYAFDFYRVKAAIAAYGLDLDPDQVIARYRSLIDGIEGKQAMGSIKVGILLEYMDKRKTKSQVMQLLMYIAIRSILGKKKYRRIYFDLIRARMFGFNSPKDVDERTQNDADFKKYQKRDSLRTILTHLKLKWKIITAATKTRGLIFSTRNKMTLLELTQIAEATKLKNRIKALQMEEKLTLEKVKQMYDSAA
jgi:hypothetical protein